MGRGCGGQAGRGRPEQLVTQMSVTSSGDGTTFQAPREEFFLTLFLLLRHLFWKCGLQEKVLLPLQGGSL